MNNKASSRERRRAKIKAKVRGSKECPRLVVFRSLSATYAQLIDDESGRTICSSSDLKIKKGSRVERAKQIGQDIAEAAKKAKINEVRFDRAGYKYHGVVKSVADGAREGGLKF